MTRRNASVARRLDGARPAVGYARVSTTEQAAEGLSLEAQAGAIRTYCAAHGLALDGIVVEAGASGKTLDRPELQRLLARIHAGEVGAVVVVRLDRLSRRTRDLLALVEDVLRRHGVDLISLSEQLDTRTPSGVMVLTVLASVAQLEREMIGERTRAALAYKRERGERLGTTPLGFRTRAPGAALEPVEAELAPVRYILRRRAEGATFRTIAAELTAQGLPTKRGGHCWYDSTVRTIWRGRARYAALLPTG